MNTQEPATPRNDARKALAAFAAGSLVLTGVSAAYLYYASSDTPQSIELTQSAQSADIAQSNETAQSTDTAQSANKPQSAPTNNWTPTPTPPPADMNTGGNTPPAGGGWVESTEEVKTCFHGVLGQDPVEVPCP